MDGEDEEVARQYRALYPRCLPYARRICPRDPALDAEDIMHTAWIKACAHLAALPGDDDRRKYLNRAILTVVLDHRRGAARRPILAPLYDHHIGGNAEDEALLRVELAALLPLVPAALLWHVSGWALAEIAAALGVNVTTVATQAHRWRAAQGGRQA